MVLFCFIPHLTLPLFNRDINATESQRVLKEVENKLRSYPFKFKEATILSGQQEGAYGWVTVNYLLNNFVKVRSDFYVQMFFHFQKQITPFLLSFINHVLLLYLF